MTGPRDEVPVFGVPVDYLTGRTLTEGQISRIRRLNEGAENLLLIMHESEGSDPGNPSFQSRRMAVAATQLELAIAMAIKAALESK